MDHLVSLVVKASTLGVEDPEFNSHLRYGDNNIYSELCYKFHITGLVVKVSASRAVDPGFDSCFLGGQNSSVGSVWARCPQRRGIDPPLGKFSSIGDFSLGVNMGSNSIPQKLFRMRV